MSPTTTDAETIWAPETATRTRGTLALVAGAGESPRVYERFARRLASDGYVVGVFETAEIHRAAGWLAGWEEQPRVLVGSDAGAVEVLRLAAAGRATVDGIIVAGLPVADRAEAADLDVRTACPVHLAILADDSSQARTSAPQSSFADAAILRSVEVPVLAIHGGSDTVASLPAARRLLQALPQAELVETVGGLHDALNDQSHRSVAAAVVLWLERLRSSGVDRPIIRVEKL